MRMATNAQSGDDCACERTLERTSVYVYVKRYVTRTVLGVTLQML